MKVRGGLLFDCGSVNEYNEEYQMNKTLVSLHCSYFLVVVRCHLVVIGDVLVALVLRSYSCLTTSFGISLDVYSNISEYDLRELKQSLLCLAQRLSTVPNVSVVLGKREGKGKEKHQARAVVCRC